MDFIFLLTPMVPILIILVVILIVSVISTYNGLIKSYKHIEQSKSLIDVYLKKRFDLIPNLVECVKGYMNHEKEVIMEVTKLRMSYAEGGNKEDADKLNNHYSNMIALAEAYPEIKASENFLHLQKEIANVESEISAARRIYSTSITTYNNKVQTFPSNIFAKFFGYETVEPVKFDVEDVNIKFYTIDIIV